MKGGIYKPVNRQQRTNRFLLQSQDAGFTILETLIVLAVTATLFASFVMVISGKQGRTQFQQSVNNVKNQIEQVVNDVQAGYYPSMGNFTCVADASSLNINARTTPDDTTIGANKDCVFLGRVLQFGVVDNTGDPRDSYQRYTIAGLREATSIPASFPTLLSQGLTTNNDVPENSERTTMANGLEAVSMRYVNSGASTNIGAFAFVTTFSPGGDGLMTGSQTIQLIPIGGTSLGQTKASAVDTINNSLVASYNGQRNPNGGVQLCLKSATSSNQSGLITIGGGGKTSSVTLAIKSSGDCS